jgi:hypothetical protein
MVWPLVGWGDDVLGGPGASGAIASLSTGSLLRDFYIHNDNQFQVVHC